jgi:hypothetical protein
MDYLNIRSSGDGVRQPKRGLQMRAVMASQYMSEGHSRESTEGAKNWWYLLEQNYNRNRSRNAQRLKVEKADSLQGQR